MIIQSMQERRNRQQRARVVQMLIVVALVVLAYLVACSEDCPGKDIGELTEQQRAEVVGRWSQR